jgi:glycosyltransferase involved in cell wall biosynthesis
MNSIPNPKVSVVVPNYNYARFLRRRIESVLNQSFQDFEIILLDDCSTDESKTIICEYAHDPRVRIEFNEKNSGTAFKQWNKGVALAQGEFVWIAEADDFADERLLERLVPVLETSPDVVLAYCRSWRVSADDRPDGFLDCIGPDPQRWESDHSANGLDECRGLFMTCDLVPNASAVVFRKAIYDGVGGADETLSMTGDWKVWFAMVLRGRMAYISDPLNYYRFHDKSVCGRDTLRAVEAEETLRVVRWMQDQVTFTETLRAKINKTLEGRWIGPVLNPRLPRDRRWTILRSALAIDPQAFRRLALAVFRSRFWHPLLDVTRPVRHALGLRLENFSRSVEK